VDLNFPGLYLQFAIPLRAQEFSMKNFAPNAPRALTLAAAIVLSLAPTVAIAQAASTWSQEDAMRIGNEVQKRLGSLNNYGVFDWITFGFHGKTVVLKGFVSRPSTRSSAANVLKGIEGVASVDNRIEVVPTSPNDDRIRAAVYNRIYTQPSLRKYNANQGSVAQALGPGDRSVALMAGGITNDPPRGFHAIHIIVRNGNVTLYGVVNSQSDATIANIQANSTPGVFSVDDDLVVAGSGSESKIDQSWETQTMPAFLNDCMASVSIGDATYCHSIRKS
jgi:hyperosmotically inducible periplasmic protein